MARRRLTAWLAATVLGMAGTAAAEPLRNTIHWVDGSATGKADFEGTMGDGALEGRLVVGDETLLVSGEVDTEGAVAGTVTTEGGAPVLTFETTLVDAELSGEFTVTGAGAGAWETDSGPPPAGIPNTTDP